MATDTALIQGAAFAAKQHLPSMKGLDAISTAAQKIFDEEVTRRKGAIESYEKNAEKILQRSGSLGESYFNETEALMNPLRDRYVKAVRKKDKSEVSRIMMELNTLSTNVQSTKESLEVAAGVIKNDEGGTDLSSGVKGNKSLIIKHLTDDDSSKTLTKEGFIWNSKDIKGWNGEHRELTIDDLMDSLTLKDNIVAGKYLKEGNEYTSAGHNFRMGGKGASNFNFQMALAKNKNHITKDNIMSLYHDDFMGTDLPFVDALKEHPELTGLTYSELGLSEDLDTNQDGVIDSGDNLEEGNLNIIMDALINPENEFYSHEFSQEILADFMTQKSQQQFNIGVSGDPNISYEDMEGPVEGISARKHIEQGGAKGSTDQQVWDSETETWISGSTGSGNLTNETLEQQDVWAGVNGHMFNPAVGEAGEDVYVGRKIEKGKLTEYGTYDYDANYALLKANKPFPDMFGNIYEPAMVDERSGRVLKWKIKKAGSGMYIMDDDGKKEKHYSSQIAIKNAFGGTYTPPTSNNIG